MALAVLAASLLLTPPADSAAPKWRAGITFTKNQGNPANSRLVWHLYQRRASAWKVVETHRWRAGSGMLGKAGRNECVNNLGWLPNGTYRLRQYDDYPGHKIKGRAFRLGDKQCANRRGDQLCRWEFPSFNEYKSAGCIKLAPADLRQLAAVYHRHFKAGVRYAKGQVVLRVTG